MVPRLASKDSLFVTSPCRGSRRFTQRPRLGVESVVDDGSAASVVVRHQCSLRFCDNSYRRRNLLPYVPAFCHCTSPTILEPTCLHGLPLYLFPVTILGPVEVPISLLYPITLPLPPCISSQPPPLPALPLSPWLSFSSRCQSLDISLNRNT